MTAEDDRVEYAVVGIGINVNMTEFAPEIRNKATSIAVETGSPINRADLLRWF